MLVASIRENPRPRLGVVTSKNPINITTTRRLQQKVFEYEWHYPQAGRLPDLSVMSQVRKIPLIINTARRNQLDITNLSKGKFFF